MKEVSQKASLAEVVYGLDDSLNTVMLFGHNFAGQQLLWC